MTRIRPATPDDLDAAWRVWHDSLVARDDRPVAAEIRDYVRDRLRDPETSLLVAEDEGEIIGMLTTSDGREEGGRGAVVPGLCHIGMVFVAPGHWGGGVGTRLLEVALDEARRRGYRRVQLWVVEGNERAIRLYAAHGFRHTGETSTGDAGEIIGLWSREL